MTRTVLTVGSALLMLAGVATANAATTPAADPGPVEQNSRAMAAADQLPTMNMRQQITDQLTKAGFTEVTVTPPAFYIHAKNKQGDPVAMVIGPEGFTEVTEVPAKTAAAAPARQLPSRTLRAPPRPRRSGP